jgi:hypothetical protein
MRNEQRKRRRNRLGRKPGGFLRERAGNKEKGGEGGADGEDIQTA